MVKIVNSFGKEEKIGKDDIEDTLKDMGLNENIAKEASKRIEEHAQDGWTEEQLRQQIDVELVQIEREIDTARLNYKQKLESKRM